MTSIKDMTEDEVNALNEQTRADLAESVEQYETTKTEVVSSAIEHLIHVTESETIDIKFSGPGGSSIIKVMASPPQKILTDLVRIGDASEDDPETNKKDENRLCEILEYICVSPKIPYDVWMSGDISDEVPARIIFELMKFKMTKHEEMVTEVESFRPDKRGAKNSRGVRTPKKGTK